MPDLLDRRKQDLQAQLKTLPDELDYWRGLSAENEPYEKHHSQINALAEQMLALIGKVEKDWGKSADFTAVQKAQRNCAAVHTIWNYFREKLLMRSDERLGAYLRAADAYVWSCYEPVLIDRRKGNEHEPFREPPLVTFDTEQSPWALSRLGRYKPHGDPTGATATTLFDDTLSGMPIAILGIPWYTTELLPNLAALAHETGHVVESDFSLVKTVESALAKATAKSALCEGWSVHWRKEVFADLFACYTAGPSFVWVLADNIPDSPETTAIKKRPSGIKWGEYPPATLRMLLNLHALRELGAADDATAIETYWKGTYAQHAMTAHEDDVTLVVKAFYAAVSLPKSLDYAELTDDRRRVYNEIVKWDRDLELTDRYDPRALVGVASAVDRTPAPATEKERVWQRLQTHIVSSRPPGVLDTQKARTAPNAPVRLRTEQIADLIFAVTPSDDD